MQIDSRTLLQNKGAVKKGPCFLVDDIGLKPKKGL